MLGFSLCLINVGPGETVLIFKYPQWSLHLYNFSASFSNVRIQLRRTTNAVHLTLDLDGHMFFPNPINKTTLPSGDAFGLRLPGFLFNTLR